MIKTGDRLGRFELKNELGRGSHGAVFEAVDVLLGERVAIKCLQPWLSGDVTLRERFKRELVLTRRVSHPGVCRLHDLHEEEGVLFISMQHIEGKSLSQVLRAGQPSQDRVIQILRGVCAALAAAHEEGVVHRDLKPANIMITTTDRVVVLDFGIATATGVNQLTRPGEAMGSVPYVPPEVWHGEPASKNGDQYALGVTGFVCLTLELPYTGKSALDVLDAIRGPRPTIRSRFADVDLDLEAAIMKAMAIKPLDRFENIAAFDDALRRIADRRAAGEPASPTPEAAQAWLMAATPWSVSSSSSLASSSSSAPRVPSGSLPLPIELPPPTTDPTLTLTASLEAQLAPPRSETSPPIALPVAPPVASPAPEAPAVAAVAVFDAATGRDDNDPLTVPSSAFVLTNDRIPTSQTPPEARLLSTGDFDDKTALVDRRARSTTANPDSAIATVVVANDDSGPMVVPGGSKKGAVAAVVGLALGAVVLVVLATSGDPAPPTPSTLTAVTDGTTGTGAAVDGVVPAAGPPVVPVPGVAPVPDAVPDAVPDTVPVPAVVPTPPLELVMPDEPVAAVDPVVAVDAVEPVESVDGVEPARRASVAPIEAVAAAAAKRGVRPGDVPALDAALTRGRTAARANNKAGVDTAARAARAALDAVVVDKAFVSAKLARFNKAFDGVSDPAITDKLRPLAREVLGRVSKGDWAEANRQLNDGMTLLARARTKKP